ncbi:MAG: hypothetical protein RL398_2135 [Planctomycetota bacterium]|jgi:hypothetical protein
MAKSGKLAVLLAMVVTLGAIAYVLAGGAEPRSRDEVAFLDLAYNLAFEGEFAHRGGIHDPRPLDTSAPLVPTAYRAPGLPLMLAPIAMLGGGLQAMRIFNACCLGASLLVLFRLAARGKGEQTALLAMLFIAGSPAVFYSGVTLYPQAVASLLLLCVVWMLPQGGAGFGMRRAAGFGAIWGALVLLVPIFLLLLPVCLGVLLVQRRIGALAAAVALSVAMLAPLGWGARNQAQFGAFVMTATSSGYNLACGNCPSAEWNTSTEVSFPSELVAALAGKDEVEADKVFRDAVREWAAQDPFRLAVLYAKKCAYWFAYSNDLVSDRLQDIDRRALGLQARYLLLAATVLPFLILLLVRCLAVRAKPLDADGVVVIALYVVACLVYAVFFVRVRFRIPFDWVVAPLVAEAAMWGLRPILARLRAWRAA